MSLPTLPSETVYPGAAPAPDSRARTGSPLSPFPEIVGPRTARILDFDIENRPLSYWYDGKCTAEVTAIAWAVIEDEPRVSVRFITPAGGARQMLEAFTRAYNSADIVTGHYIRRHDLGIIQAALVELDMPRLGPKMTSDTRIDLKKFQDIAKSQEALGAMLGLKWPKEHMTQTDWREANRLTAEGIAGTCRRVVGDVKQHIELRAALLERGLLGAPRMWRP